MRCRRTGEHDSERLVLQEQAECSRACCPHDEGRPTLCSMRTAVVPALLAGPPRSYGPGWGRAGHDVPRRPLLNDGPHADAELVLTRSRRGGHVMVMRVPRVRRARCSWSRTVVSARRSQPSSTKARSHTGIRPSLRTTAGSRHLSAVLGAEPVDAPAAGSAAGAMYSATARWARADRAGRWDVPSRLAEGGTRTRGEGWRRPWSRCCERIPQHRHGAAEGWATPSGDGPRHGLLSDITELPSRCRAMPVMAVSVLYSSRSAGEWCISTGMPSLPAFLMR